MKEALSLTILLCMFLFASSAPPTCYSRILSLSQEITDGYADLQKSEMVDPCVMMLPTLYLDIHNYCVLAKLRDFVAYPQCWQVPQLNALKEKARNLYTIMISFCRQDLVFLSDDCSALEIQPLSVTDRSTTQD
ncbi:cytokine-like protein 1 [Tiliqua scincoides]|uniref:cytokine-like protein 1 n=1 Tax=Tiliqua scincoides TaxID=71010 RepID=UPI0034631828